MRVPSGVGGRFPTQKPAIDKVAEHIADVVTVAEGITSGHFDKVSVPEVKVVATSIKEVKQVAEVEQYVRMLAQDLSNIDLIGSQLAGVLHVSNNMAVVLLLHSRMADLLDIKKSLVHIDAVALNEERINSAYEIIPEIATLVSHMDSLVHIAQVLPQLEAVFKSFDTILLVGSNVGHVVNVSTNMDTILGASVYVHEFYTLIEQIKGIEAHIVDLEASSKVNAEEASKQALEAKAQMIEATKQGGISTTQANAAKGSADSASASKVASEASQVAAKSSEDKAKASETASASSADKALVSEGNAKKSTDAAKVSETNAKDSESAALSSKNSATSSASTATTKAAEAASSASSALASKNAAEASASTAVAAADTATQKALASAGSEASALSAATRAEQAAQTMVGALIDAGPYNATSGVLPTPSMSSGVKRSSIWKVTGGGTAGGIELGVGDSLVYTASDNSYYKIDNTESVTSINGKKGSVTLSSSDVGAEESGTAQNLVSQHATKAGAHPISGVAGLRAELDAIKAAGGDSVLDVRWFATRTPMRTGYTAGDGQTLSRALYPDALAAIQAGLVPVCTDAEWLSDPAKRGCFTLGDGSTTFRVPDYNGVQSGSYGPVYLGGGNTTVGGAILRDRIQNITGEFEMIGAVTSGAAWGAGTPDPTVDGAFAHDGLSLPHQVGAHQGPSALTSNRTRFDASRTARTGDTTRPITAEGCWAVKLFGAVQNAGSADASALLTEVAALRAEITAIRAKIGS